MTEGGASRPRVVCDFKGLQIRDSRDHIQLHFTTMPPPRGMRWCMKDAGFQSIENGETWIKPHSPMAIMDAQNLANTFFEQEKP